jgi:hypothetical protein
MAGQALDRACPRKVPRTGDLRFPLFVVQCVARQYPIRGVAGKPGKGFLRARGGAASGDHSVPPNPVKVSRR